MAYNFLTLTNRVLKAFNEVQLTSGTFAGATGFHAEAKDAINMAIFDVFTEQDAEWPWTWAELTQDTSIGTQKYTSSSTIEKVDWDSFRIQKPEVTVSSITQSSGTATVTTASTHYLIVGDKVVIRGADQTDYNGEFTVVTVPTTTTFTFVVSASATTPATGTIYCYPPFDEEYLELVNYDVYRKKYMENDRNTTATDAFSKPDKVVRLQDENFLISPRPDRVYPIVYEGFDIPDPLENYDDVPVIPEKYQQTIVDKALHYAYMFRDNIEQASVVLKRWKDNVTKVRRIVIHHDSYMAHE